MSKIRQDYAAKDWLVRCPDAASDPVAFVAVCAIATAALWWLDVALWSL